MKFFLLVAAFVAVSAQFDCGPAGIITIAGSSIVEPIAVAWAAGYQAKCPTTTITVEGGGSSTGARRVCNQTSAGTAVDIGNMSRDWTATEVNKTGTPGKLVCNIGNRGRPVTQIDVAIDGITIALINGGLAEQCLRRLEGGGLSIDQLRWIYSNYTTDRLKTSGWDPASIPFDDNNETSHKWTEISPLCPDGEIKLSAPDSLSSAFDIFKRQVLVNRDEDVATMRPNGILQSADDDVLVQFLQTSSEEIFGDAISFFSLSSFFNRGQTLYGIPIKAKGASVWVHPNATAIGDGTYKPFSYRNYMNVHDISLPQTGPFISYGLSQEGIALVEKAGFIPIPTDELASILARIAPPVAVPGTAPVGAPVAGPIAAPVAGPVGAPPAGPVTFPISAPVPAPVAGPVTVPVVPIVVPASVPVPVPASVAGPVTAPVTSPVTFPISLPVAGPVTVPVVPIIAPVSVPVPVLIPVVAPRIQPVSCGRTTKTPTRAPTKSPIEKARVRRICIFRLFRRSRFCR